MPSSIFRFLRRRIVLFFIFAVSLSYFLIHIQLLGPFKLEGDTEFVVQREHPLIWTNNDNNSIPAKNDAKLVCRNSVQGRFLLVDDRGFVCPRFDVLPTGCCNIENTSPETKHLTCDTCNEHDCCAIYEYCVSCCLHPEKKSLLEQVMERASRRQMTMFASVRDNFELCLAKCRTDSHSVKHENKYRDPKAKHCYGKTDPHESAQKDGEN